MTSTRLQIPGLGQAHNVYGRVKHACEYSELSLNWDSGVKKQQKQNFKNKLHKI